MTPDPDTQDERQMWAAYRLILSWPKRDETQRDDDQRHCAIDAQHTAGNDDERSD